VLPDRPEQPARNGWHRTTMLPSRPRLARATPVPEAIATFEEQPMPIACLRIPHFALRIALLDSPQLDGSPLVLGNPESARAVVLDATPEAQERGVRAGMSLREATALCPAAVVLGIDPVRELAIAGQIGSRLDAVSPLVEPDPDEQGCWYIDLTGLDRYYGGQEKVIRRLLACVPAILRARAGIGPGKFTARIAAGSARAGGSHSVLPEDVPAFLADASVRWLPLPPDVVRQLERLGITTLGAFTRLPGRKVAARFGPGGRRAWELARGHDDRPVVPPPRTEVVTEELAMPVPAVSREMLMIGLRQMVGRAFGRPVLRNRHVRQVTLQAVLEGDRRSWERTLTLKEPCGHDRLVRALELRLQALEMPGPIELVRLEFSGIVSEVARQATFAQMGPRAMSPLTAAIHQLKHRYGSSPVYHIVEVEPWSRIPERRHALLSYDP
jgi:DNA polymerase-4/protein ImuB